MEKVSITARDGGTFNTYIARPAAGTGPAVVVVSEIFGANHHIRDVAQLWADEGYVALVPDVFWRLEPGVEYGYSEKEFELSFERYGRLDVEQAVKDVEDVIQYARALPETTGRDGKKQVGVVGFCLGGRLGWLVGVHGTPDAVVSYYGVALDQHMDVMPKCPVTLHFGDQDHLVPPENIDKMRKLLEVHPQSQIFVYKDTDHGFNCNERAAYNQSASLLAHTRSLARIREACGPDYDLEALWDQHCAYEFETRDVDATMKTMVAEPYVNHIPTMTGGVGYRDLYRFYKHHFIPKTPPDTRLVPVSRTIGIDRLVDEMVFTFTHTTEIDWMLPGVPPTNKKVEIPLLAVVRFRGDKLYNEHIYWDQASVLVQIGLLDPEGLPVAGVETAQKLMDKTLPSNTLMARWGESS